MFDRKNKTAPTGTELLAEAVRTHMPDADADTHRLVVAVCGLVAAIVFVDRQYKPEEEAHVRGTLANIDGLSPAGVDAVCKVLREHITKIAVLNPQQHTRELRDHADIEFRREVLDVLVDLAASDHTLSLVETDLLRRTATAMGLAQDDYVHSQARHREKIKLLK